MLTDSYCKAVDAAPRRRAAPRLAGIEMLRTVAVTMVLIQHLPSLLPAAVEWWAPDGVFAHINFSSGVDVFFCISGFVVTRRLLADHASLTTRDAIRHTLSFWLRRVFRLWPTAWLGLLVAYTMSVGIGWPEFMAPSDNLRLLWAGIGMYVNFLLRHESHFPRPFGMMTQYWSLSLEEQFYLVLPVLLVFARKAALPALGAYALYRFCFYRDFWTDVFLRPGCLVSGVVLAYFERTKFWNYLQALNPPAGLPICASLALVAVSAWVEGIGIFERWGGVPMFQFQAPAQALVCAVIVILAAWKQNGLPDFALRWSLATGRRTYAVYVVHPIAYASASGLLRNSFPHSTTLYGLVIAAPLLLIATEATHRLIERPLWNFGTRTAHCFARRRGLYQATL